MKWLFLILALVAILPLAEWLRRTPSQTGKIWILVGVLPFVLEPLHLFMAVVSWPFWPGYVKGIELSAIDLLAGAIFLSLPKDRRPAAFRVPAAAYLFAVMLSSLQSNVPLATIFYPVQLLRMYFLFSVVARSCSDVRVAPALLQGMGIGLCLETCVVIWQRFALGELQTPGTFGHQNGVGLVSHFVVFPFFALLLAEKRGWQPFVVPLAGVLTALLTVSRATLGLGGFGYAVVFTLSAIRKWTFRKGILGLAGAISIAALVPLAIFSLESRFAINPLSDDYDERAAFESASAAMLSDHPMGVGANNYVVVANSQGYNGRAGVAPTAGSSSAQVHNVYRLVSAETGYFGLFTFVVLLMQPLIVAFVWGWRNRGDLRGDILLGMGVSLLIVYIHSFFEWVFVTYYLQYFFAFQSGLIVGLARQLGYQRVNSGDRSLQAGSLVGHRVKIRM